MAKVQSFILPADWNFHQNVNLAHSLRLGSEGGLLLPSDPHLLHSVAVANRSFSVCRLMVLKRPMLPSFRLIC